MTSTKIIEKISNIDYEYGFESNIDTELIEKGLSTKTINSISDILCEPDSIRQFRLDAYNWWIKQTEPDWAKLSYPKPCFDEIHYYAKPKVATEAQVEETFGKLGINFSEVSSESNVAIDAVLDSISVNTSFKNKLSEHGIIFCSMSEAIKHYPELIKQYLGSVVPKTDNYYAALNSCVFGDGTFVYVPKGVHCPIEIGSYFRINAKNTGQFERTLIIAEENSYVSYLEGCTAPSRKETQLHAAIVEIIVHDNAEVKYSTVQNWYPGDIEGNGGIYNFVTKRGICKGKNSKLTWVQVETGSAVTWKYPSTILRGDNSTSEFYSVAVTNNFQQADTGTKMIHLGKNTKSRIISKGISLGNSSNAYRGLVRISPNALNARNYTRCDSLLIGNGCSAHTYPHINSKNKTAIIEHEATTSKVSDQQIFYCKQRGITQDKAVSLIVNGFVKDVLSKMPGEFAIEAHKLLSISLENSIG